MSKNKRVNEVKKLRREGFRWTVVGHRRGRQIVVDNRYALVCELRHNRHLVRPASKVLGQAPAQGGEYA